jgi:hypothetical protein
VSLPIEDKYNSKKREEDNNPSQGSKIPKSSGDKEANISKINIESSEMVLEDIR